MVCLLIVRATLTFNTIKDANHHQNTENGKILPISVPVGSQVPVELGFALYLIITTPTPRIVVISIEINIARPLTVVRGW